MTKFELYDTTLRDGSQQEGISFSVEDKLKIMKKLDELGVHYIEGGWPGANPKDNEFFLAAKSIKLNNSILTSFGMTKRPNLPAKEDPVLNNLLDSQTSVITLVGKSSKSQVIETLRIEESVNFEMITDSVKYLIEAGREVFFDAEHFFDGYKDDPVYAVKCLLLAQNAGASRLILCDTNGGTLINEVESIVKDVKSKVKVPIGIHCHNDSDVAVGASLAALNAGAFQVQGCINGYGERCGNANILSVIANLNLKVEEKVVSDKQLKLLREISVYVSEIANKPQYNNQPFVGTSAFTHKAGLHASAVARNQTSYQHIDPELVGNSNKILVSELAGRSNIMHLLKSFGLKDVFTDEEIKNILTEIKEKENKGFQYEGAEASVELFVRKKLKDYKSPFDLLDYMVIVEQGRRKSMGVTDLLLSEATVKVEVNSKVFHTAAEGAGPVNALDSAIRKGLITSYPELEQVSLVDYKVRVVEQAIGTSAVVRVLIESTNGNSNWHTVGASTNIIDASCLALCDSIEWWLINHNKS